MNQTFVSGRVISIDKEKKTFLLDVKRNYIVLNNQKDDDVLLCTHGSDILKNMTSNIKEKDFLILKGRLEQEEELAIRIESYEVVSREK